MNYCNYCGVELDKTMTSCPLCGLTVGEKRVITHEWKSKQPIFKDKISSEIKNMTAAQKRKLFWEISAIILISGILVTLVINWIESKNITWSKYTLVSSLSILATISFFTLLRNRPFMLVLGSFISNAALLLLLDLISSNIGWGTKLGIPILFSLYALILIVLWLIRISHRRGFNILALIFIAMGLFLICIEVFVSLYFNHKITLSWSIIAASSMIPISTLLFFVHYRLKSGIELRRFFNI
ncbi:MAG: DUF6320 domain-containing protein [Bacteroidales bacterium]|nr:DUF6320 domain-containing protein [Bacteroidales bacterium]